MRTYSLSSHRERMQRCPKQFMKGRGTFCDPPLPAFFSFSSVSSPAKQHTCTLFFSLADIFFLLLVHSHRLMPKSSSFFLNRTDERHGMRKCSESVQSPSIAGMHRITSKKGCELGFQNRYAAVQCLTNVDRHVRSALCARQYDS